MVEDTTSSIRVASEDETLVIEVNGPFDTGTKRCLHDVIAAARKFGIPHVVRASALDPRLTQAPALGSRRA